MISPHIYAIIAWLLTLTGMNPDLPVPPDTEPEVIQTYTHPTPDPEVNAAQNGQPEVGVWRCPLPSGGHMVYGGTVTEDIRNRCAPEALFIEEKNL